jgi:hypothetical protein
MARMPNPLKTGSEYEDEMILHHIIARRGRLVPKMGKSEIQIINCLTSYSFICR